jgi:integrase/recombinase XerD
MKKLTLTNPAYEYLEKGFAEWLDILGYCANGVYSMPILLRAFLHHLEKQQVKNIHTLQQKHIRNFYDHISTRPNQRGGGALSDKYILMHMQAVEKFLEYLHHKGVETIPTTGIKLATPQRKEITVLTPEEIKQLFEASNKESDHLKQEAMNARDKAMLVIYYSCGLRRNEGVHVDVDDINFDTRILHVRKGKNYKQRFVPFNKTNAQYLQEYIYDHRANLINSKKESRLFITRFAEPMSGGALYVRLKLLQTMSDDIHLQQKTIGLHTLRHSIATHLLQAGMSLEKIARFLGHASMDSTQIYTHLVEQQLQLL